MSATKIEKAANNTKVQDMGLLEEDDEFEEFPNEVLEEGQSVEEEIAKVWEDNWDDDTVEEDFSQQLRKMREIMGARTPPALTPPPSKKRCIQSTPPTMEARVAVPVQQNGTTNGTHDSSNSADQNGRSQRSSRTSSSNGSRTSTPPTTPSRSSGRQRKK